MEHAANEALAAWTHEKSTLDSLRNIQHRDVYGNIISKPPYVSVKVIKVLNSHQLILTRRILLDLVLKGLWILSDHSKQPLIIPTTEGLCQGLVRPSCSLSVPLIL